MHLLNSRKIKKKLDQLNGVKCNETLKLLLEKPGNDDGTTIENFFFFTSKAATITNKNEVGAALQNIRDDILSRIDRFTMQGSGWTVTEIWNHTLQINQYDPLRASGYIPLPKGIQNRKATVNIKNDDDRCFIYCLGRALDPTPEKHHWEIVSKHLRKTCDSLGLNEIVTPVMDKDLPKIEKKYNISINLFSHKNSNIYPLRQTKNLCEKHVNLLITSNEETSHYVLIKDFNKLCCNVTRKGYKKHFCMQCIQNFTSEEKLQKHIPECMTINNNQTVELPEKGSILKAKSLMQSIKVPFVIYADLEALLECVEDKNKTHKHVACSYGYKVVCCYNEAYSKPFKMYRGVNSLHEFFEAMFNEEEEINKLLHKF